MYVGSRGPRGPRGEDALLLGIPNGLDDEVLSANPMRNEDDAVESGRPAPCAGVVGIHVLVYHIA